MQIEVNDRWLPKGPTWDLNIEHNLCNDAGQHATGKPKLVWHTVESPYEFVDKAYLILKNKNAAPHLIYGYRKDYKYPVVIQCLPFHKAARSLQHPAGTPETNRAGCIQIEVCGYAALSTVWSETYYKGLANLAHLVESRCLIPRTRPRVFNATALFPAKRFTPQEFASITGHVGHEHVPNQPAGHWDPGAFRCKHLLELVAAAPHNLKPR